MIVSPWNGEAHRVDLGQAIDLSLVLAGNGKANPSAWYGRPQMVLVRRRVCGRRRRGSVNWDIPQPHGHGMHRMPGPHHPRHPQRRRVLPKSAFPVPRTVATLTPAVDGDRFSTWVCLTRWPVLGARRWLSGPHPMGRQTHPGLVQHQPPYFTAAFMDKLVESGVKHGWWTCLSGQEVDGGRLEAHHAFWKVPDNPRHG